MLVVTAAPGPLLCGRCQGTAAMIQGTRIALNPQHSLIPKGVLRNAQFLACCGKPALRLNPIDL